MTTRLRWGGDRYSTDYSVGIFQNYNADFEPFSFDGKTFVCGTTLVPIKEIVYQHNMGTIVSSQRGINIHLQIAKVLW